VLPCLRSPRRNSPEPQKRRNRIGAGRLLGGLLLTLGCLLPVTRAQAQPDPDPALERILGQMDSAAANFHTTEASVLWDQYQKVVDEHEIQKGKVFFRRSGDEIQMAADLAEPDQKYVLFSGSKVQVYQPRIEQVTAYNTGKNRQAFESFLVLGFGGRGHDMLKAFQVKYLGVEKTDGVDAAKLELVPRAANLRNNVDHIILWIDSARGISVQQQFFFGPAGDYRLAKYSAIKVNEKIPDAVFKLKTTGKTKFISPQG
jgi:outer membrane lipoprotein-sorting protein